MAVVAGSTFAVDGPVQRDGSQWVRETHEISGHPPRVYYYLLAPGDDPQAIMEEHAAAIAAEEVSDGG